MAFVQPANHCGNSEHFEEGRDMNSRRRPTAVLTNISYPATRARRRSAEQIHHARAEDGRSSIRSTGPPFKSSHMPYGPPVELRDKRIPSIPISPKSSPGDGPVRRGGIGDPFMTHTDSNIHTEQGQPSQQRTHDFSHLQPTVEDPAPGSGSWASQETPRPTASQQSNQANLFGPFASFGPDLSHQYTPNARDIANRQQELFEGLEQACTSAARAYWRSQCDSALNKLVIRSPRHGRRSHYQPYPTDRFRPQPQLSLADYLARIAQKLWERALASGDHAAELEAVHRMGNLYAWGERIAMAARGEMAFATQDGVFRIVMAARDLASWLLNEEAKREIDEIWQDRLLFGGLVLGASI